MAIAPGTPDLSVGVDGGGSGCRVAIADASGKVLGQGAAGPANVTTDMAGAIANVQSALNVAMAASGLSKAVLAGARAHLGLAGVLTRAQGATVAAALPMLRAAVTDDRPTQLRGALGTADGALVALGTGTMIGVQQGAQARFVGGWGLVLSDEASGGWLGQQALMRTLHVLDGLATGAPLSARLAQQHGGASGIVAFARNATPADFAGLAPQVIAAAEDGDALADTILRDGAAYIARALEAAGYTRGKALCLSGGIGPAYGRYLDADLQAGLVLPKGSALDGALALASERPRD